MMTLLDTVATLSTAFDGMSECRPASVLLSASGCEIRYVSQDEVLFQCTMKTGRCMFTLAYVRLVSSRTHFEYL